MQEEMYDVLIVGGGTAGLTAAIYVQRAGKKALVLEGNMCGGKIVNTPDVENYPGMPHVSGFDFAMALMEQAQNLGAQIRYDSVLGLRAREDGFFELQTLGKTISGKSVVLATGVKRKKLGLPKEDTLAGKGISYCATCDGAFFRGKDVAVYGDARAAAEDALALTPLCRKVVLICPKSELSAQDPQIKKLMEQKNLEILFQTRVAALLAGEDGKLSALSLKDNNSGEVQERSVSGLFVAIGEIPSNEVFGEAIKLDKNGYIIAGEDTKTSLSGVFAAGDCRTKQIRQLVTAASDGAIAALAACRYAAGKRK